MALVALVGLWADGSPSQFSSIVPSKPNQAHITSNQGMPDSNTITSTSRKQPAGLSFDAVTLAAGRLSSVPPSSDWRFRLRPSCLRPPDDLPTERSTGVYSVFFFFFGTRRPRLRRKVLRLRVSPAPLLLASASARYGMEMHTGTCRKRELRPGSSSASPQGSVSQDVQGFKVMERGSMLDKLPEDIFDSLYSYLPIEDAARAACVSHGFLRSWRRYPRLLFNNKTQGYKKLSMHLDQDTRALEDEQYGLDKIGSYFINMINDALENHSGFGMKALILQLFPCRIDASFIDKWLQIAVKPGIEELALEMSIPKKRAEYNFPSLLLSNEIGGATLESLRLISCSFHPTITLGCNKSLTSLYLSFVHISGEELGQFVSNCLVLAQLSITNCNDIVCFKVPSVLHHLNHFQVGNCEMLQVIEISAPKLSSFVYGDSLIKISLGAEVKRIRMIGSKPNTLCHARAELPSFMPAVERLIVESSCEKVKTPVLSSKFLHLKYLEIYLVDVQLYYQDYFCLVSFLDASPALETFVLHVETGCLLRCDSVLKDLDNGQLHLRQMPECLRYNLKNVIITGFSSATSLIELTNHIVRNASALVCMTLDTARGCGRRTGKTDKCQHMSKEGIMEAQKALEAVNRCIEGMVPSSTNFKALEPCCQCGC